MQIALHQMKSGINIQANLDNMVMAIKEASSKGAVMYFAPEMSAYLDKDRKRAACNIVSAVDNPALLILQKAAQDHDIWVHLGSIPILLQQKGDESFYVNRSYVINNNGDIVSQYDKLHLFDVQLSTGEYWKESNSYRAGDRAVIAKTPIGQMGLSICYDLRFAKLYNMLSEGGAHIAAIPAAFTVPTGIAHWHVILRTRAIENMIFIVAAAQCGKHEDGRETYGHSLVIDPWGEILLDMKEEEGLGYADIDLNRLHEIRAQLPVIEHRRDIRHIEIG